MIFPLNQESPCKNQSGTHAGVAVCARNEAKKSALFFPPLFPLPTYPSVLLFVPAHGFG